MKVQPFTKVQVLTKVQLKVMEIDMNVLRVTRKRRRIVEKIEGKCFDKFGIGDFEEYFSTKI